MTILIAVGFIACWVACGILAGGMFQHIFYEKVSQRRLNKSEKLVLSLLVIMGIIGLFTSIIACIMLGAWGLKFRYDEGKS